MRNGRGMSEGIILDQDGRRDPKRGMNMANRESCQGPEFDVFLAHNSQDKPSVIAVANELKKLGVKPWLDGEQIRPGQPFQAVIQQALQDVKSVAIFIGPEGLGRWQAIELRSAISQCVERGVPVIPVLLPLSSAVFPEGGLAAPSRQRAGMRKTGGLTPAARRSVGNDVGNAALRAGFHGGPDQRTATDAGGR